MKKPKISFGLQIIAILLAGVLASIVILLIAQNSDSEQQKQKAETHTVTFAYLDGTIIETKKVTHGKGIYPPKLMDDGVFRGWSNGFNAVTSDVEAHPVYHNITENNLFYFDSVYVQEGSEFFLDLFVGGYVSVSSGELILEYDTEVLKFLEAKGSEQCVVTENEEGLLKLRFDSTAPIKTETLLSQLVFKAEEKDAYSTEIILKAANVKVVAEGQELPADCATINNKIYFLQEVG